MIGEDMLRRAAALVGGQRATDYGDVTENHERIANLWNIWLSERYGNSQCIEAYDVAIMMVLLKVARLMHTQGHGDSHVDIAGYAAIAEEIWANKGILSGEGSIGL
jgi:hypothetical protein